MSSYTKFNYIFLFFFFIFLTLDLYALDLTPVKTAFLNENYKAAIREGEKIMGQNANSDELYYILGLSYMEDKNYLRATDIFEIILNEFDKSKFKEEAYLGACDAYLLLDEKEIALNYCNKALKENPQTKFRDEILARIEKLTPPLAPPTRGGE